MLVTRSADVGALVADTREQRGLTQQQLADLAGVTRDWLNRFERGAHTATLHRVFWVLDALGLVMDVSLGASMHRGLSDPDEEPSDEGAASDPEEGVFDDGGR